MKDVNIKIALLGDGMSGKTQILLTYNKIITDYLLRLHRFHSKEESKEYTPKEDHSYLTPGFYAWQDKMVSLLNMVKPLGILVQ